MKSIKVLVIVLLTVFSFGAVNARPSRHKKAHHKKAHHKMHKHHKMAKKHVRPHTK